MSGNSTQSRERERGIENSRLLVRLFGFFILISLEFGPVEYSRSYSFIIHIYIYIYIYYYYYFLKREISLIQNSNTLHLNKET